MITLAVVVGTAGCQHRDAGMLLGRWIGRPDSAAARAEREAQKYGDARPSSDAVAQLIGHSDAAAPPEQQAGKTDWEQYDVAVLLNFVSRGRIEMSLADGTQSRSGWWRMIESGPAGCSIEVETNASKTPYNGAEPGELQRRRFQIDFDLRDGACVGFLLTEAGADRQLGALYFRRANEAE